MFARGKAEVGRGGSARKSRLCIVNLAAWIFANTLRAAGWQGRRGSTHSIGILE